MFLVIYAHLTICHLLGCYVTLMTMFLTELFSLFFHSEGGGRKLNENKLLTSKKARWVAHYMPWIQMFFDCLWGNIPISVSCSTFMYSLKLPACLLKLCSSYGSVMCPSLSGLTPTARPALPPAGSVRAQFISLDHITVRAVHIRKVLTLSRCIPHRVEILLSFIQSDLPLVFQFKIKSTSKQWD